MAFDNSMRLIAVAYTVLSCLVLFSFTLTSPYDWDMQLTAILCAIYNLGLCWLHKCTFPLVPSMTACWCV